jgi:hypothetical protein
VTWPPSWPTVARRTLLAVFLGGLAIGWVAGSRLDRTQLVLLPIAAYAVVGAVVSARQPRNPIGWLFLCVAALTGLSGMADGAMTRGIKSGDVHAWYAVWGAWVTSWFWFPLFAAATVFTLLLFPDGLLSSRWRPVLWVTGASTGLLTLLDALPPQLQVGDTLPPPCRPPYQYLAAGRDCQITVDNPVPGLPVSDAVGAALVLTLSVCFSLAIVGAVLRMRRSTGVARLQMRWFAFAATVLFGWVLFSALFVKAEPAPLWSEVCFAIAWALIPASCGVAITRYRLYDIDRIISRTTSYAIVTLAVLAVYAVVVTSVTRLLPDSSTLAVAAATLAAAALVRPLLRRVQDSVDRRFNRARYDAQRTVETFGARLRNEIDTATVTTDLVSVVDESLRPQGVTLWLRRT